MFRVPDKIAHNAKAVAGAVAEVGALGGAVVIALEDGAVSSQEVATLSGLLAAAVAAVYAIWRVENRKAPSSNLDG